MKAGILLFIITSLTISILLNPSYALAGVILLFPLEQLLQSSFPFFLTHTYALNVIVAGTIGLSLIRQMFSNFSVVFRRIPSTYYITFCLFFYAGISTQWSINPNLTTEIFIYRIPYLLVFVFLFPLTINNGLELRKSYNALLFYGVILSLVILFLVEWDVRRIVLNSGFRKITGNPLEIARFCGEISIIALLFGFKQKSFTYKIISIVAIILSLVIIIKSGTRGQLISLLVVLILFNIKITSIKNIAIVLILSFVAYHLINYGLELYWGDHNRWSSDRMESAVDERLNNMKILMNHWLRTPWSLIFGLGNSASYDPRILGFYPHNIPLEVLCEEGLIGITLFCLILLVSFRSYFKNKTKKAEVRTISALLIYSLLISFKQGSMLGNYTFFMYAIILQRINNEYND